jgi:hypothetical protein
MKPDFAPNIHEYKVLTPNGFQSFAGVAMMGIKPIIRVEFEKGAWVECTHDHKFYIDLETYKEVNELEIGDTVLSLTGDVKITNKIHLDKEEPVYDLIEVENGHRYYTNTLLSSNCEFLVYDETLINSLTLAKLEGIDPTMKMGQVRWYKKPSEDMIYVVALDPALGTGGNNAAIQVLEMPSMIQVAEWCHNLTPIEGQIKILREINRFIADCCPKSNGSNLYWSVENNTLGEAALIAIKNVGEENIAGLFVSEPVRKGHVRKFRKGFNTTHKTKISACARLKHMIETGRMTVHSKMLVTELKAFIAAGVTFKAKVGENDDLVLALLLAMRINAVLADWDQRVFDIMSSTGDDTFEEEWEPPMPIFISTGF